ncbi:Rieske (2Fe-2S) protein [Streptomyces sp. NPDC008001]|uniref:Rieske (2Fe-2S) protein n=1 Tax=Streptomyces sp. NPDC008001 TaxID=3364804 RepID=UPI0036E138B8
MNHTSRTASVTPPATTDSTATPGSTAPNDSPDSTASRASYGSTRRSVVAAAGAAGLVTVLAACGGGDGGNGGGGGDDEAKGLDGGIAKTSDIPEGGGKVFPDRKVVVTQPAKGQFKAFSAVCTHQGCVVKDVSGGTVNCPCHGSKFNIADGSVQAGPAQRPLPEQKVSVHDGSLHLG